MLFRKSTVAKIKAEILEAQASNLSDGKIKKVKFQRQADMSKHISHLWKSLPAHERVMWDQKAAIIKREHEAKHPNYRYHPATKPSSDIPAEYKSEDKGKSVKRRTKRIDDDFESSPPSSPPPALTAVMTSPEVSSPSSDFPITPPMNEDAPLPEYPELHSTSKHLVGEPYDSGGLYFPRENSFDVIHMPSSEYPFDQLSQEVST